MDFKTIVDSVYREVKSGDNPGRPATYIPELSEVDPEHFGVHLTTINHEQYGAGDCNIKFSIQSISKVISLVLAYRLNDGKIWERVGVEPSGNPFNSLVQLEYDHGIPRNPFINAGALVVCDMLISQFADAKATLINFVRDIASNQEIDFDKKVAESERKTGFRNAALVNFLKSFNNLKNEVAEVLDLYYHMCSISMSCKDLSGAFLFLANNGRNPLNQIPIINGSQAKRINAIMLTCGFYDEAGEFSYKVGLPGKSGVGGGIVAVHPNNYAIAVWSPRLNKKEIRAEV